MVISAQRTIYSISLELDSRIGKPFEALENTTLNEKFGVASKINLDDGEYPEIKYYVIGVGGNDFIKGNQGYNYSSHSPIDAALFQHIPFVMRPVNNDLLESEKTQYRMRVIEEINGVEYACYYLKLIPNIELRDYFFEVMHDGDKDILSPYNNKTDKLLNPTPRDRKPGVEIANTAKYITKLAKLEFSLYKDELEEVQDVLELRGLTDRKLTEIGVCTGMDKVIDDVTQATNVQVGYHIDVNLDLSIELQHDTNILRAIEIGGTEPIVI